MRQRSRGKDTKSLGIKTAIEQKNCEKVANIRKSAYL